MAPRTLRIALLSLLVALIAAAPASAAGLLPDLKMEAPYGLIKTTNSGASFLAFGSGIDNAGPGILKVEGQLIGGSNPPTMTGKQMLLTTNSLNNAAVAQEIPNVGNFQFSYSSSHYHWHFLRFEDYSLLSVPNLDFVAPTRKTGFCIGGLNKNFYCGRPPDTSNPCADSANSGPCMDNLGWNDGTGDSRAMGVVAAGTPDASNPNRSAHDDYDPTVEGQDIEITNVPTGRYCLSFTVNPTDSMAETTYADNAASALVDIGGTPGVGNTRTISQPTDSNDDPIVYPNSGTCGLARPVTPGGGAPGGPTGAGGNNSGSVKPLTKALAAKFTKLALRKRIRHTKSVTGRCSARGNSKVLCKVKFKGSGARYSGTVTITQRLLNAQLRWYYKIDVKRRGHAACAAQKNACPARVRTKTVFGGVIGASKAKAAALVHAAGGEKRVPTLEGAAWPAWYLLQTQQAYETTGPLPPPPVQ